MEVIGYRLKDLSKEMYYQKHLEIINPFLPKQLTEKKVKVLAAFMALQGDLVEKDRFNSEARKIIRKAHNLSHGNLGNYLKDYRDKGLIYIPEGESHYAIKPFLFPEENSQGYKFKITRKK